jgi:hypothetical protein
VKHLQKWQHTPYPEVVRGVVELLARPPLPGATLLVNATWISKAVLDMVRAARPRASVRPVVIAPGGTAARVTGRWDVPQRDLAGALLVLSQQRRLSVVPTLPDAGALVREIKSFSAKAVPADPAAFEGWRPPDLDSLCVAAAMAVWAGERGGDWISPDGTRTWGWLD